MANQIAVGLTFNFIGDGTTSNVVLDLTKDPYHLFSLTSLADRNNDPMGVIPFSISFEILKNLPTSVSLIDGTFVESSTPYHFAVNGDSRFSSASISGSQITLTPASGITGLTRVSMVLEFSS